MTLKGEPKNDRYRCIDPNVYTYHINPIQVGEGIKVKRTSQIIPTLILEIRFFLFYLIR